MPPPEERELWSPVEARWEEARLLRENPPLDCSQPEREPPAKPCRLRPISPKPEGAAEEVPGAPSFTGRENPGGGPVMPRSVLEELSAIARDWRDEFTVFTWGP